MHVDRLNKDHDTGRNIDMALWIVAKVVSNNRRSRTIQSYQSCHEAAIQSNTRGEIITERRESMEKEGRREIEGEPDNGHLLVLLRQMSLCISVSVSSTIGVPRVCDYGITPGFREINLILQSDCRRALLAVHSGWLYFCFSLVIELFHLRATRARTGFERPVVSTLNSQHLV